MRDFQNKTYWIVGASEGLGRALAIQLAEVGAKVIISARNEERLIELSEELDPSHQFCLWMLQRNLVSEAHTENCPEL